MLLILVILLTHYGIKAQESEETLSANARELFDKEDYAAAAKAYSTLVSNSPQNPEYNFRFGAARLFTEEDKEAPLEFLKFAVGMGNAPPLAHFYYGLGLHLNYQFDRAIAEYKKYQPNASKKEKESALVAHYIAQCNSGKTLVSNFTDISVVQRTVLPRSDFYRNYDLSEFGGKIIVKPVDFMSEEDKKRDDKFLMYFQESASTIYYASYSDKNATGKDLYFIQKLPTGDWSTPSKLSDVINTPFDEDFPFIHPEGNTLYFASKGHNSMGGYDIFKSKRRGDGTWTDPVNMEFAINTPWDDFMFITDLEEKTAWFASNRETSHEKVTVYKIGIARVPLDLTLISGVFEVETGSRKAKITIEDVVQNKVVGTYESDRQLGGYLLDLRGSGKYKFIVEAEESSAVHTGMVEVPREKGLKQFRQEMRLVVADGKEQLQIINHFDEPIEDEQLLTAEILKKQASLNVNTTVEDLTTSTNSTAVANEKPTVVRDRVESLALAERAQRTLEEDAEKLHKKAAALYEVVQANYNSDDPEKFAEATIAAELAAIYRNEAEKRQTAAEANLQILSQLKNGSLDDAAFNAEYTKLAATQNNFKALENFEEGIENNVKMRLDPAIAAYESKAMEVETLASDIAAIEEEITYYKTEIDNTKDEAIKQELQTQISEAELLKPQKQTALDRAVKERDALFTQKELAEGYLDLSISMLQTAESESAQMTGMVSAVALNEMQTMLNKKAASIPALVAFVNPKEAQLALNETTKEARKGSDQVQNNDASREGTDEKSANSKPIISANSQSVAPETEKDTAPSSTGEKDLNKEIESIASGEANSEIVTGDYERHFTESLAMAGSAEDPIIGESRKAELYDQWAENIAYRIDSLEKSKTNNKSESELASIDTRISALTIEKKEKEDLAMSSYQRIATLSDSQQLKAEENEQVGSNQSTIATKDVTQEMLEPGAFTPSVTAINNDFEANIEALEAKAQKDNLAKAELAAVHESWADTLTSELELLGAQIKQVENEEQRTILEDKAAATAELRLKVIDKARALRSEVKNAVSQEQSRIAGGELQQQLVAYTENYNRNAFTQIERQVQNIADEQLRASQSEVLYKNWLMGIQNEQIKTKARIDNTSDPEQIKALEAQLQRLNEDKTNVRFSLDTLQTDIAIDEPRAPETVLIKGSERFEGYIPVETETPAQFNEKQSETESQAQQKSTEAANLENKLSAVKKKKERIAIEDQMAVANAEGNRLQAKATFYEQASEKLASTETQLLTMSADDSLPSLRQEKQAKQLEVQAQLATTAANKKMEIAQNIRKKKERIPALREARVMQIEATQKREVAALASELAEEMSQIERATIAQNFIILPGEEVVLPGTRRTLNPAERNDVRATYEFEYYNSEKQKADSIRNEAEKLSKLERQAAEAGQRLLLQSASAPVDGPNGATKMDIAEKAYENFEQSDSLSKSIARLNRQAAFIENEANRALLTLPQEAYMNIIAYYNSPEVGAPQQKTEQVIAAENPTPIIAPQVEPDEPFALSEPKNERNQSIPVRQNELTKTIFEVGQQSSTPTRPIPIDPPMPSGLVYKVQVGAFRNPISPSVFRGITPIVGESTQAGFIRYSAGEFSKFGDADAAKDKIRSIGYADAFVVAYLNGKRISVAQARAVESGQPVDSAIPTPPSTTATTNHLKQGQIEIRAVENIPGTFFTVQVGVYSKPVSSKDIFNLTPLNQENLPNGTYRYTTGKFSNEAVATQARDEARALGVADAFVTAYKDGVRITVDQARQSLGSATETSGLTPDKAPQTQSTSSGTYRILLGTFNGDIPIQVASKILMLSAEGVDKIKNNDGSSSYYYGNFSSQSEAENRATQLRNEGLTDVRVEKQP